MNRILVVDDNKESCKLLVELLEPERFLLETVNDPHNGFRRALSGEHELIILDVMLCDMAGLTLLRNLRMSSQIPVLVLTTMGDDNARILGLELGADDYLPKPFNPRELVARIRAILRRVNLCAEQVPKPMVPFEYDDIILDQTLKTVKKNTHDIKVTTVECSLLYQLLKKAGQVLSRKELSQKVLNRNFDLFDRSIDVHISSLRKKLGFNINGLERIKTIRGVGYCYIHKN